MADAGSCPICGSDSPANMGGMIGTLEQGNGFDDTMPHTHASGDYRLGETLLGGGPSPGSIDAPGSPTSDVVLPVG